MAGSLDKRTPRSVREAKAFRAVQIGSVTGAAFVVTTLLWIVGAMNDHPAVVLFILTLLSVARFAQVTGLRNKR